MDIVIIGILSAVVLLATYHFMPDKIIPVGNAVIAIAFIYGLWNLSTDDLKTNPTHFDYYQLGFFSFLVLAGAAMALFAHFDEKRTNDDLKESERELAELKAKKKYPY